MKNIFNKKLYEIILYNLDIYNTVALGIGPSFKMSNIFFINQTGYYIKCYQLFDI